MSCLTLFYSQHFRSGPLVGQKQHKKNEKCAKFEHSQKFLQRQVTTIRIVQSDIQTEYLMMIKIPCRFVAKPIDGDSNQTKRGNTVTLHVFLFEANREGKKIRTKKRVIKSQLEHVFLVHEIIMGRNV